MPGGSLDLSTVLHPTGRGITAETRIDMDHFDYGILARRAVPETGMKGIVGLDVDLRSRAPSFEKLMAHANGHVNFSVVPQELESGVIDLWAVGLMSAVLPALDSSEKSVINCVVGRFNIENGKLTQESLYVDTTKMSVNGTTEIDFEAETVRMDLVPEAKKPQFFALATPVRVNGRFEDFEGDLGAADFLNAGDVVGTVVQMMTSVVHVPVRRLFGKDQAPDGEEACLAAMNPAPEPEKK